MQFCMTDKIQRNLRMETNPLPKFHNPVILYVVHHCQNPLNLLLVLIYVIEYRMLQYQTDNVHYYIQKYVSNNNYTYINASVLKIPNQRNLHSTFCCYECRVSLLSNLYCSYFGQEILSRFSSVFQLNAAMTIKIPVFWDDTMQFGR